MSGDSVTAEFSTNKNVTMMQCRLGRGVTEFEDCKLTTAGHTCTLFCAYLVRLRVVCPILMLVGSSGNVTFTGLTRQDVDEFVLHIQARTTAGEVVNLRRVFRIGQ